MLGYALLAQASAVSYPEGMEGQEVPNSEAPATWTPQRVWATIDQHILKAKLAEIAEEMHKRVAEDKSKVHAEGHKRGNAAFYPVERTRLEERRADE